MLPRWYYYGQDSFQIHLPVMRYIITPLVRTLSGVRGVEHLCRGEG